MEDLRKRLIRLAHDHPELQEKLLPLLAETKQAAADAQTRLMRFDSSRWTPSLLSDAEQRLVQQVSNKLGHAGKAVAFAVALLENENLHSDARQLNISALKNQWVKKLVEQMESGRAASADRVAAAFLARQ